MSCVLLALSWCFILLVFVRPTELGPQFVDCVPANEEFFAMSEVNKVYPIWITAGFLAHVPALLMTSLGVKVAQDIFSLSCTSTAKLELTLLFAFSSIQWLLVASAIDSIIRNKPRPTATSIAD